MSAGQVQRPNFFEGQYLGAADLDLAVEYNRLALARHALGAHTWGIVIGLELVSTDSAGGGKDVYVQPGTAIDGFGRQIIVNEAIKLSAELLDAVSSSATGECTVWIRFVGERFSSPAEGFRNCDDQESFARLQEGYELIVTPTSQTSTSDQNDPVVVAGESIDAIEAPVAGDPNNIHCDSSVPYQTFPSTEEDPDRCWLVLLGCVKWDFSTGAFDASEPIKLAMTRRYRRYLGAVTEDVLAADGLIRLRRRDQVLGPGESASAACAQPAIEDSDLTVSDKTADPMDLVWVEGHLRVIGDTKLFGGQLDLRPDDGDTAGASLLVRRVDPNALPDAGKDLQVVIGSATEGKNRLAVGPMSPSDSTLQDKFVVLDNGKVGVQASDPQHDLQVGDGTNVVSVALRGTVDDLASSVLTFEKGGATNYFRLIYDTTNNRLLLQADGQFIASFVKAGRKVGIQTLEPDVPLHVFGSDDASLSSGTGLMVLGDINDRNVVFDKNEILARNNGAKSTLHLQADGGDLHVHSNQNAGTQLIVRDDGRVGMGTSSPNDRLDVRGEIKLSPSGAYFAASAPQTALVLAGRVNSIGTLANGTGFTVTRMSIGRYRVTFDPVNSFAEIPSVVVTPVDLSNNDRVATLLSQNVSTFEVVILDVAPPAEGTRRDTAFNFMAIGRR